MFELAAHALGKVRSQWTSWVPYSSREDQTCIILSYVPLLVNCFRMWKPAQGKELVRTTVGCAPHVHAQSGSDMLGGYMAPVNLKYPTCSLRQPDRGCRCTSVRLGCSLVLQAGYDMLGGYMSPVNDAYQKKGLAPAQQRVEMCKLAAESSDIVTVDSWEAQQPTYQRSLKVLQRVKSVLHEYLSGSASSSAYQVELKAVGLSLRSFAVITEAARMPGSYLRKGIKVLQREDDLFHSGGHSPQRWAFLGRPASIKQAHRKDSND